MPEDLDSTLKTFTKLNTLSARQQAFNPAVRFSKNTAYLTATYRDKELFIEKMSQNFEALTGYGHSEVS